MNRNAAKLVILYLERSNNAEFTDLETAVMPLENRNQDMGLTAHEKQ